MVPQGLGLVHFAGAHEMYRHTQVTTAYTKVGMLAIGGSSRMVFLELARAMLAHVVAALHHRILESMVAAPRNADMDGGFVGSTGLLAPRNDAGIGD